MEKIKIEMFKVESNTKIESKSEHFDAAKNILLVHRFFEKKTVDNYFPQFEKNCSKFEIAKLYWTSMLQSVFEGKAAEIYSALSLEKTSNYQTVKQEVLEAYKLVTEAY